MRTLALGKKKQTDPGSPWLGLALIGHAIRLLLVRPEMLGHAVGFVLFHYSCLLWQQSDFHELNLIVGSMYFISAVEHAAAVSFEGELDRTLSTGITAGSTSVCASCAL